MRTKIPEQRVVKPATACRGIASWPLIGFGIGAGSATTYLLLGGKYFWDVPHWASIVFFPGFFASNMAADWGVARDGALVVGVVAVGLAYATLAILARLAWLALEHNRCSS